MTVNRMSKSSMSAPTRYRNASTGVTVPPVVSGGNLSEDSTYYYRTFLTSGTLSVSGGSLTADVLVISGGGSGGPGYGSGRGGAGGGAGGMKAFTLSLSGDSSVTIGAGGAGVFASPTNSGTSSSISTASTTGGGGGAHGAGGYGLNGGSGGGNGGYDSVAGLGIAGEGNNGYTTTRQAYADPSAGGGGAGAAGGGPTGGAGLTSAISGTSTTYATGGTGGSQQGAETGASGAANTGNGGNGGGGTGSVGVYGGIGGNGGSGIVVVRYAKASAASSTDSFELIGTVALTANQAAVTFTGIPQQYKHLQIRAVTRNTSTAGGSTTNYGANGLIRFNGDATAGNYRAHYMQGDGASASAGDYSTGNTGAYVLDMGGVWDTHTASAFEATIIDILDATSTYKNKTIRCLNGFTTGGKRVSLSSSVWLSNSAIASITITQDGTAFKAGSNFYLYGIRG